MLYQLEQQKPTIDGDHFIAPTAVLIGDVHLKNNASVWFNVVIRADNAKIEIGENSNIQDGSILHVDPGKPITIGKNVTVGHKVMLHGCLIEDGALIGMNAVVLNGAKIGKGSLIGANALVPENMDVPPGSLVLGSPGKIVKQLSEEQQKMMAFGANHYVDNAKRYNATGKVIG